MSVALISLRGLSAIGLLPIISARSCAKSSEWKVSPNKRKLKKSYFRSTRIIQFQSKSVLIFPNIPFELFHLDSFVLDVLCICLHLWHLAYVNMQSDICKAKTRCILVLDDYIVLKLHAFIGCTTVTA